MWAHLPLSKSIEKIYLSTIRGRPLIIWEGGVVQNGKKNRPEGRRKKKSVQGVSEKKIYFRSI